MLMSVGEPMSKTDGVRNPPPTAIKPVGHVAVTVTWSLSPDVGSAALTTVTGGDFGFLCFFLASAEATPRSSGRSSMATATRQIPFSCIASSLTRGSLQGSAQPLEGRVERIRRDRFLADRARVRNGTAVAHHVDPALRRANQPRPRDLDARIDALLGGVLA